MAWWVASESRARVRAHIGRIHAAHIGEHDPLPGAAEQGHAEGVLQLLDLARDGALGQVQLLGRPGHAAVAGGRLEGQEIADIGKKAAAEHKFIPFENNLLRRCRFTSRLSRAILPAKFNGFDRPCR